MSSSIRPQREEQHVREAALCRRELTVLGGIVREQAIVLTGSLYVVDISKCADSLEQAVLPRAPSWCRQPSVSAQPGPRTVSAAKDVSELDAGLIEERREVSVPIAL